MGIGSSNFILNIGRLSFLLLSLPFIYLLVFLTLSMPNSKFSKYIQRTFFHSFTIRLFLESCLETIFFSLMSSAEWNLDSLEQTFSTIFGLACGVLVTGFPVFLVVFLIRNRAKLNASLF